VLALTAIDDQKVVSEALRIGFRGYLTKDTPVSKFVRAARTAVDGQVVYQQSLGAGPRRRDEPGALEGQQLTPREREVLALLVEGLSGVVIANRLGISRNTVRTHVQSILTKLQVHSRLEAATFAVRHRLVHTNVPQAVEAVG
jgi:DNA-binding NarL/FixJ family response regulator